jgi:hypothetical protein
LQAGAEFPSFVEDDRRFPMGTPIAVPSGHAAQAESIWRCGGSFVPVLIFHRAVAAEGYFPDQPKSTLPGFLLRPARPAQWTAPHLAIRLK